MWWRDWQRCESYVHVVDAPTVWVDRYAPEWAIEDVKWPRLGFSCSGMKIMRMHRRQEGSKKKFGQKARSHLDEHIPHHKQIYEILAGEMSQTCFADPAIKTMVPGRLIVKEPDQPKRRRRWRYDDGTQWHAEHANVWVKENKAHEDLLETVSRCRAHDSRTSGPEFVPEEYYYYPSAVNLQLLCSESR